MTIPTHGYVWWENPYPAYPFIKPNHKYKLHTVSDGNIAIYTHDGFLGLDENELILTNGEAAVDLLEGMLWSEDA